MSLADSFLAPLSSFDLLMFWLVGQAFLCQANLSTNGFFVYWARTRESFVTSETNGPNTQQWLLLSRSLCLPLSLFLFVWAKTTSKNAWQKGHTKCLHPTPLLALKLTSFSFCFCCATISMYFCMTGSIAGSWLDGAVSSTTSSSFLLTDDVTLLPCKMSRDHVIIDSCSICDVKRNT